MCGHVNGLFFYKFASVNKLANVFLNYFTHLNSNNHVVTLIINSLFRKSQKDKVQQIDLMLPLKLYEIFFFSSKFCCTQRTKRMFGLTRTVLFTASMSLSKTNRNVCYAEVFSALVSWTNGTALRTSMCAQQNTFVARVTHVKHVTETSFEMSPKLRRNSNVS